MDLSALPLPTDPPAVPPPSSPSPSAPPLVTTGAVVPVANPGPPTVDTSHPPYAEMIYAAITALKEQNGSSRRAIANYIESAYSNLPAAHSALLTHHLKRLKNSGQLVMVKKSYKIPRSTLPATTTEEPKMGPTRGRGRPRKSGTEPVLVALGLVDQPKRGPGRPRKSGGVELSQNGTKKRRGRPPKNGSSVPNLTKKKHPGRPRKPKTLMNGVTGVNRVSPVPAQALTQAQTQALDQPNSIMVPNTNIEGSMLPVQVSKIPRPRGRPKKDGSNPIAKAGSVRRQRQLAKKPRKSTGRPVGRPKKNATFATTQIAGAAAQQQALAVGELQRKFEYFQSRVKQAVNVLKPHITSDTQINVVAAIQDLEEVATVDLLNISYKDDAQPLPNLTQS